MAASVPDKRAFRFGVFELDLHTRELRKRGVKIKLGGQAFHLLVFLLERSGEVVTREQLRHAIWPGEEWGDHDQRLNKAVNKVREALSDSAETPRYVETLPRLGYRFIFPVTIIGAAGSDEATLPPVKAEVEPTPFVPAPEPAVVQSAGPSGFSSRSVALITAATVAAAIMITSGVLVRSRTEGPVLIQSPATTFVGREESPSFSPDGKQVVFSWNGERDGVENLFILTAGVGGARRLTEGASPATNPAWSPDGSWIAFRRGLGEIWVVRPDGSGERRLSETKAVPTAARLAWSPDSKVLIVSDAPSSHTFGLFALDVATGDRRRLTSPPSGLMGDANPAFSHDGRSIAFTRSTAHQWRDIFIADVDSRFQLVGEPRRITNTKTRVDAPDLDSRQLRDCVLGCYPGRRHQSSLPCCGEGRRRTRPRHGSHRRSRSGNRA
jgi:DNA-binding winged helix-turn-helix (wHTH) protein